MAEGNLIEDLIIDILSRLPVKSLVRFRCIHKSWCSLLKSSYFVTTHLQNPKNKRQGFIFVTYEEWLDDNRLCWIKAVEESYRTVGIGLEQTKLKEKFNSLHRRGLRLLSPETFEVYSDDKSPFFNDLDIVGSCNGLICLQGRCKHSPDIPEVYLCNPSLKQHKIIPQSPLFNHPNNIHYRSMVFGCGYDSRNNDYKVVMLHCLRRDDDDDESDGDNHDDDDYDDDGRKGFRIHSEVFTLGMDSWRNIAILPDDISFGWVQNWCFFNGAIHRLAFKESISDSKFDLIIFSFDICSEVFGQFLLPIRLPDNMRPSRPGLARTKRIHVYRDLLCLVDFHLYNTDKHLLWCDIWVMEEYGVEESWTKLHSIKHFSSYRVSFSENFLGFGMNDEMIFHEHYFYLDGGLIVYYPDEEFFKYVEFEEHIEWKKVVACRESLVSLE